MGAGKRLNWRGKKSGEEKSRTKVGAPGILLLTDQFRNHLKSLPVIGHKNIFCAESESSSVRVTFVTSYSKVFTAKHLNLFLDMVPSSSANFTRSIFPRCVFSWRKQRMRVMADRASLKRKFEFSNAPLNKRKKTSPNLFWSSGHREQDEFSKGENC